MKMPSYADALKMGKEKLKEALIPVRVKKARKQAELEMCNLEEQVAVKEAAISDACTSEDLNFKKIIELQDDLAMLERRQRQYESILKEMFPED